VQSVIQFIDKLELHDIDTKPVLILLSCHGVNIL